MRKAVFVCAIALLVGGCSDAAPDTTSPEPTSSPQETSSAGPQDIVGEGAPLEPGTYTYSPFEPPVTFELGDGWEGGHTNPEFFDVWRELRVAVMFGRPSFFFDGTGERVPAQGVSPEEALDLLGSRATQARPAPSVVLDGGPAPSLFLTTEGSVELFGGPSGTFATDPSFRLRVAALDVDGALVLVMVSSKTPIELEDRLAVTEMLGTIDFTP